MQRHLTTRHHRDRILKADASRGYTLVELITVVVILGILSAIAVPRFFDAQVFEERGFYEEVAAALRYGQKIAVGSGCPVLVTITATSYKLEQQTVSGNRCDPLDSSWAVSVMLPGGQTAAGTAPAGITLGPVTTYQLDGLGQTDLGIDLTVTVGSSTMTVQAASGYVVTP